MRYTRLPLFSLFSTVGALVVPMMAFAQSSQFFGPIIPQTGACVCPGSAPNWGCVLQVLQNVINLGVALAVVAIVLSLVYAAFILMTNGANPHARMQGRRLLLNSVIGLSVVLLAWVSVDFVMKAIYNPRATLAGDVPLGPWNAIWAPAADGSDLCIVVRDPVPLTRGDIPLLTVQPSGNASASGDCSTAALSRDWGNPEVAQIFSCILANESHCDNGADNPTSTARGRYQVVLGLNSQGHNLNFPVCTQAAQRAGFRVQGDLNCSRYMRSGDVSPTYRGNLSDPANPAGACLAAASDPSCNTAAAQWLFQADQQLGSRGHNGFGPWWGIDGALEGRWNRRCITEPGFRTQHAT
jgi:hypothetical protein